MSAVAGFLEKNSDTVHGMLAAVVASSSSPFMAHLLDSHGSTKRSSGHASSGARTTHKTTRTTTLAGAFCRQLGDLAKTINATQPHFVRCIKPNALKCPGAFLSPLVLTQLLYGGVMESVRIRQQGYVRASGAHMCVCDAT